MKIRLARIICLSTSILFMIGCNEKTKDVSSASANSNATNPAPQPNSDKSGEVERVPVRFIPQYDRAEDYYVLSDRHRSKMDGASNVDELLAGLEGSRFVLVETMNDSWGGYSFALIYEQSSEQANAFSGGNVYDQKGVTQQIPLSILDHNLELLQVVKEQCLHEVTGFAGADAPAFHFVWSDRKKIHEYWFLGSYLLYPKHVYGPISQDCREFLEQMLVVFKNCKPYF